MKAYSTDLREKLVLAYETGEGTLDEVADTFGVGRCTLARMMKLWRAGQSLAPLPHGGGYPATLNEKLLALLQQQVAAQPDATLSELAAYLKRKAKAQVHPSNICRALQKLGLPRKKKPRGSRKSRSRPAGFPSAGGSLGSSPLGLHGRNWLSFGLDQSLRACGAWRESRRESAAQSWQGHDLDREFGFARAACAIER
jgi:transposase